MEIDFFDRTPCPSTGCSNMLLPGEQCAECAAFAEDDRESAPTVQPALCPPAHDWDCDCRECWPEFYRGYED